MKDCNVEGYFFDLFVHALLGDGYFLGGDVEIMRGVRFLEEGEGFYMKGFTWD